MRAGALHLRAVLLCTSGLHLRRPPPLWYQQRRTVHPWLAHHDALAERHAEAHLSLGDLPDFRGPARLLKEAYKKSLTVKPNPKIANGRKRAAKHATQTIDAYASHVSVALRDNLKTFRTVMRALPPFQAQLSQLTLAAMEREGGKSLRDVETNFDDFRRTVVRVGKQASADAANAANAREAKALMEAGLEAVQAAVEEECGALYGMIETVQLLRRLPRPVDDEPVLVLVGMPNVGKSSLVTATSTGTPEINDYPFTTRRLKMGHVISEVTAARYQVMDTPGVLARPDDERNPMEGLTLAAVEHLPSAVVFVMDLSGSCGAQSAPLLQLRCREQIRAAHPERPWLDVRTKADLPLADEVAADMVPPGALEVSAIEGTNIDVLKVRLAQLVGKGE
jgi:nucleolar GTP-binding protein